ncbi:MULTISPECIES: hypothetical protein [Streptomyces]|uniref:hypothetical protein n=1 Tax=Streptomyces TaxID=1883 RepID=UPI0035E27D58
MNGRVIYADFEYPIPLGGARILSAHVKLLAEAGVDAYRWSPTPGFRYAWFDDSGVPTLSGMEIDLTADDLLVVPEISVLPGHDPAPGARKVVFNQGHFLTFLTSGAEGRYPGFTPDPGIWTISRESVDVLSRAHPYLPTPLLIPNPIDGELFRPAERRVPSIAWMPRNRPAESLLLERLLRADPRGEGVELRPIRGLSHEQVAQVLADTSVFVALGSPEGEGFGLPVAEALASGCLVAGYPLGGGEELFDAPSAWRVPDLRTGLLADRALELVRRPEDGLRAEGRQWLLDRYHRKTATDALLAAVDAARTLPGGPATATHFLAWSEEYRPFFVSQVAAMEAAQKGS